MLYEERFSARWVFLLLLPALIALGIGLYMTYKTEEGIWGIAVAWIITLLITVEVSSFKLQIDENSVRIRGGLGLFVRITVRIEDIEGFIVKHDWKACGGRVHFSLPARGCVLLRKRNGGTVSFSTNNPEEVARVLATLGVPREP
ncbi:hypothetical protein FH039_10240 [Thermococcus indicus]|uniref:DUF3093 domain-containing protein n=1 Tax=Thermococcus indicus TaxID=2586643 RepID=A0A4Y5SQ86_9EURY|nr:hypothetical protein FH039_10240 [Thermococcus indicus]